MKNTTRIPFLDLVAPHEELKDELTQVFRTALEKGAFVGGPMVEAFEHDFAAFCEVQHCVGVGSGTDALRFALIAAGLKPGEIVVTVPNTFIATTEAISQAGGRPDFVDVDERTYNMDPALLAEYLEVRCHPDAATGRLIHRASGRPVAAIVPVHLYGQMADMDPILELAGRYGLTVIEDACQAHGAEYYSRREQRWRKAGSMGTAAGFSFYPGKNLGACGEGGAVTTDDLEIARKVRMLRDHGQSRKYIHDVEGYNGRLDAIQAGALAIKLRRLSVWNEQRRQAAARYRQLFAEAETQIVPPEGPSHSQPVYHLFVIRTRDRDELVTYLAAVGIGTGIHYPIPVHIQAAHRSLGYKEGDFPVTEAVSAEIVSLPMYPSLTVEQQSRIADEITRFLATVAGHGTAAKAACVS